jgi:hypothetical protein
LPGVNKLEEKKKLVPCALSTSRFSNISPINEQGRLGLRERMWR